MQASYFLGIALRKQLKYAEAAKHLDRALEAANEAGDAIKDEIWREVAACKYSRWQQESTVREDKQARLKMRLKMLLDSYYQGDQASVRFHCCCVSIGAGCSHCLCSRFSQSSGALQDEARARDERDFAEVFSLAQHVDNGEDTDTAYTCTLTMEPFRDPVCTPDGNSYERAALQDHLSKVWPAQHCVLYIVISA